MSTNKISGQRLFVEIQLHFRYASFFLHRIPSRCAFFSILIFALLLQKAKLSKFISYKKTSVLTITELFPLDSERQQFKEWQVYKILCRTS